VTLNPAERRIADAIGGRVRRDYYPHPRDRNTSHIAQEKETDHPNESYLIDAARTPRGRGKPGKGALSGMVAVIDADDGLYRNVWPPRPRRSSRSDPGRFGRRELGR